MRIHFLSGVFVAVTVVVVVVVLRFSRSVGTGRRESGNKVAILPSESLSVLDCLTWSSEL